MGYSLPEAVKAAHNLSPAGQENLRKQIASLYGKQKPLEVSEEEKKRLDDIEEEKKIKAKREKEAARKAEDVKNHVEEQAVKDILAAIAHPDLFEETRESALRVIAEGIGVAEDKKDATHVPDGPTFGGDAASGAAATEAPPDFDSMTPKELRLIAAERGIEVGTHAKKPELIDMLNQGRGGAR